MKLATLRDGSRDGRLVVVSPDLSICADARSAAPTLQAALDEWEAVAPRLEGLARALTFGELPVERFDPAEALAPLPRAYAWLRGAEPPERLQDEPLMYRAAPTPSSRLALPFPQARRAGASTWRASWPWRRETSPPAPRRRRRRTRSAS